MPPSNYKLGVNWAMSEEVGYRATISTGFKAPTPGQSNASNISTQIIGGVLTNQGVIPASSPAAVLRGSTPLDAEESFHFSIGTYMTIGAFDITMDYFDVNVEDRLSLSNDFTLSAADLVTLSGQGIDASDISQFRFFTNQFETDTTGLDLVATTETEWLNGVTTWNFALNMTTTEVSDRDPALFGADRVRLVQDGTPGTRWNVTANHNVDQWRFLARVNYYGEYYDNEAGGFFDDAVLVDLEAAYSVNEDMTITVGGRNVSDEQGCSTAKCGGTPPGALGLPYSQFSPFGFNGASVLPGPGFRARQFFTSTSSLLLYCLLPPADNFLDTRPNTSTHCPKRDLLIFSQELLLRQVHWPIRKYLLPLPLPQQARHADLRRHSHLKSHHLLHFVGR